MKARGTEIACSTGTLPRAFERRYHELEAVFRAMAEIPVCTVELVLHPDWRPDVEPRTNQPDAWQDSAKWECYDLVHELQRRLKDVGGQVQSVHANRDLGVFLGACEEDDRRVGQRLLRENCELARLLGAGLVVIHAWDTWAPALDPAPIAESLNTVAEDYPELTLTVENLPLSARGWSQAGLMQHLAGLLNRVIGFTLDLSWSSLYGNLDELLVLLPRVRNIHVQGRLVRTEPETGVERAGHTAVHLEPRAGELDMDRAIEKLLDAGYAGQWTLELNRAHSLEDFRLALSYLREKVVMF